MNVFVLLAAGRGTRMAGAVDDKALADVGGTPSIARAAAAFRASGLDGTFIVADRDDAQRTALGRALAGVLPAPPRFVRGGAERHDSVRAALAAIPGDDALVFLHDAARPLLDPAHVSNLARLACEDGAAILAHRVTDTIKRAPSTRHAVPETLVRSELWAAETPQVARAALLRRALDAAAARGISPTDDAQAIELLGHSVAILENTRPNPKLTTPADLAWVDFLLSRRTPAP